MKCPVCLDDMESVDIETLGETWHCKRCKHTIDHDFDGNKISIDGVTSEQGVTDEPV